MSFRSPLLLLGVGLLSLGAAAHAQPSGSSPPPPGPRWQPPADRADLKARLEQRFDAADANHDGVLTPEERRAKRAEARTEMRDHLFARLDTDKNGVLSKAEFEARPARGGPEAGQRHPGERKAGWRPAWRGSHDGMAGEDGPMRHQLAAYRDKPITKAQFVEAGLSRFDRVDTDHDGKISPAERDAARKAMRDRLAPAQRPSPPPPGQ